MEITDKIKEIKICKIKIYEASGRKDDVLLNNIVNIRNCRHCNGYQKKCRSYQPRD